MHDIFRLFTLNNSLQLNTFFYLIDYVYFYVKQIERMSTAVRNKIKPGQFIQLYM